MCGMQPRAMCSGQRQSLPASSILEVCRTADCDKSRDAQDHTLHICNLRPFDTSRYGILEMCGLPIC